MLSSDIHELKQLFSPPPTEKNSLLISFEGIEGSGKTTQIKLLEKYFVEKGFEVVSLREPGGTNFGEKLRAAILEHNGKLNEMAQTLLFASSRAQLLEEKVLPALKRPNTIVILDRYLDSSLAYQGEAAGLGAETILNIHRFYPLNSVPHITFYLKISLETSFERMKARGEKADYFESQKKDFHKKLILGLDKASQIFSDRIHIINAEESQEKIFNTIKNTVGHFQK